ncbi:MAG: hypothetical protein JW822_13785 [Spirochaetales bacterium]|nr:hypothetical protein [Spirochaetales bacterium]
MMKKLFFVLIVLLLFAHNLYAAPPPQSGEAGCGWLIIPLVVSEVTIVGLSLFSTVDEWYGSTVTGSLLLTSGLLIPILQMLIVEDCFSEDNRAITIGTILTGTALAALGAYNLFLAESGSAAVFYEDPRFWINFAGINLSYLLLIVPSLLDPAQQNRDNVYFFMTPSFVRVYISF